MSAARLAREAIRIPQRIERGPTDILKALSSTVKYTPSGPEPFLQDDPYLLPQKHSDKRIFILSYLSGRRTAKFILNKQPELFFRDDAEPKIAAFSPLEQFDDDMEFSEEDIKWCIENSDVSNGIIAYKSLEEKGVKLSNETLINFFELVCFMNEEREIDGYELEQSRLLPASDRQLINQSWKTSGLASKIFEEIKDTVDPSRVYSIMIAGLSKYNEHATARNLFNEFKQNYPNDGLTTIAYAGLITSIPNLNSSTETAHTAVDEIVRHMESNLVKPNLRIFNAILGCYRQFACDNGKCQESLKLINDMRALSIEPSLGTYAHLLAILVRYRNGQTYTPVINDILNHIDTSSDILEIRDESDVMFLNVTMQTFAVRLNNLKLAKRIHKIYLKCPNMFKTHKHKSRFLNDYFKLLITADSLENILTFYDEYIPMQFQPNSDVYEALAEALDLYQADEEIVKRIGQDLIKFKLAQYIKNDTIFRKDPSYVEALENSLSV